MLQLRNRWARLKGFWTLKNEKNRSFVRVLDCLSAAMLTVRCMWLLALLVVVVQLAEEANMTVTHVSNWFIRECARRD